MLDDLRQLFRSSWSRRARIYAWAAAGVFALLTVARFDPADKSGSAPLWIALASGVLALVSRAVVEKTAPRASTRHGQVAENSSSSLGALADALTTEQARHDADLRRSLTK